VLHREIGVFEVDGMAPRSTRPPTHHEALVLQWSDAILATSYATVIESQHAHPVLNRLPLSHP